MKLWIVKAVLEHDDTVEDLPWAWLDHSGYLTNHPSRARRWEARSDADKAALHLATYCSGLTVIVETDEPEL